jgi:DNA invertase Pin-like site-specific DNA recombinase/predicted O-methyltransferase YrrM
MRIAGQRIGYVRVSTVEENAVRQLDGVALDCTFTDRASGRAANRPELPGLMKFARCGDTVIVHSMDRLARNLYDLRGIVQELNGKGVRIEFLKEQLTLSGEDSPMASLLLSVMGAFAEFQRALIRERQREGVALAKDPGAYKGRQPTLLEEERAHLRSRAASGESKVKVPTSLGPAGRPCTSIFAPPIRQDHEMARDRDVQGPNERSANPPEDRDLLEAIQSMRRRLAEVGPERARADGDFERVSLPNLDGDALRDLLVAENAQVVIEVGLAYGSSALAIGEALISQGHQDAKDVVIDAYQHQFRNSGLKAIASAGLTDLCLLLGETSQLALPRLVTEGFIADAAFVDGSHLFHNVFVDLYFLGELVRPGGLLVLDDCQWLSVATAVRYFEVNTGWPPQVISQPTRLRAFRLPDPRVAVSIESFRPFTIDSSP